MNFKSIKKLCEVEKAFDFSEENKTLFKKAMIENYEFQYNNQNYIKYLANRINFNIDKLNILDEVENIPPLFVGTMKISEFCNFEKKDLAAVFTSSGTNGQKTQSFFDKESLERLETLSYNIFKEIGFTSDIPVHYFLFSYDISKANNVGTSWSDNQILKLAPSKSVNWMIEWNEDKKEFVFDSEKWARVFVELSREAPVRLLGFPAFMYKMMEDIKRLYGKIKIYPESFVIAGGGWKNHLGKAMGLKEFIDYMEDCIGIRRENIRDTYGMAEHGIPYCSCKEGHLHVPIFSEIIARNPITLEKVDYGQEGLLQLLTPYNVAQPNLSILSTDLVVIDKDCICGLKGDFIKSIRRGGIKKHKGCAINAQDVLNKSS